MKLDLLVRPEDVDEGPGTVAVRQLLALWASIDWFAHPTERNAAATATKLFRAHNCLAHRAQPDVFAARVRVDVIRGSWAAFDGLCARVRSPSAAWEWRFALKGLARAHSEARGFSLERHARPFAEGARRPGELFFHLEPHSAIWLQLCSLDALSTIGEPARVVRGWYLSYAEFDVHEAIEWQLAERHESVRGNPFFQLLRIYALGFLPFSLAPDHTVLFAFA